jgi:hypothetical protein
MRLGNMNKTALLYTTRIAKATNEHGEVVLVVYYTTIGNAFLITYFVLHPHATVKEAQWAGDVIDRLLEREAQLAGIVALHILAPGKDECEEVRTYTRKIPQNVTALTGVGCFDTTPSPKFLN